MRTRKLLTDGKPNSMEFVEHIYVGFVFFLSVLQVFLYSAYNSAMVQFVMYFAILGFMVVRQLTRKKYDVEFYVLLLIFVLLIINIGIFHVRRVGISALGFLSFISMIYYAKFSKLSGIYIKSVSLISLFILLAYNFLVSGSYNPNTIAYSNLLFFLLGTLNVRITKSLLTFIYITLLYGFVGWMIWNSESRTILFVLFLSFSLRIVGNKLFSTSLYKWLCYFSVIGSLIFVFVYIYYFISTFSADAEVVSLGEKRVFSGREQIWLELIERFSESPITGIKNSTILYCYPIFNPHNSLFTVLTVYGFPTYILVCYLLLKRLLDLKKYISEDIILFNSFIAYITVLLVGFTEVNLLFHVFLSTLFLIICYSRVNYLKSVV